MDEESHHNIIRDPFPSRVRTPRGSSVLSECGRVSVDVGFRQPVAIVMNPNPLVQSMFLCQQRRKVSCLWERDGITAS